MHLSHLGNSIKHMSFDVWNTLVIPNLEFSRARSELIANVYDIPFEQAKAAYTQTKRFLDTAAELDGYGTSSPNVYRLLNAQLKNKLNNNQLEELRSEVNRLFAELPPELPTNLIDVLNVLKIQGVTMNILSNTNYVGGKQLMECVFDKHLGTNFFNFTLFSDEHKVAKPHINFFRMVDENVYRLLLNWPSLAHSCTNILHIGDNKITDVQGADLFGFTSMHVVDPHDTARKLKEMIANA